EVVRFFDHYLMARKTGLDKEQRIHYFSVHAEAWQAADQWPPIPRTTTLHLAPDELSAKKPTQEQKAAYQVDFTTNTGRNSRYERLGLLDIKEYYPDWH